MITTKIIKAASGKCEVHSIITVNDPSLGFKRQLAEIERQYTELKDTLSDRMCPVFLRWFLSDAANQQESLPDMEECATSIVEQAPLNGTKAALWVWMIEDAESRHEPDGRYAVEAFGHTHIFETGNSRPGIDPRTAIHDMLTETSRVLERHGGSLLKNCVRTWLFVRDIDQDYTEVVRGRNEAFDEQGLTTATRFIASTGIQGRQADCKVAVTYDSYSVLGLKDGDMRQINALDHLNPTYEYGVAFERATGIDYADRRHLFVSGTASIDSKGQILWPGDVRSQTERMWENVGALLEAAGFGWHDVGQILVYLRDPADYSAVNAMFRERFPDIPYIILHAPVCRPGWLVEMECMAMK